MAPSGASWTEQKVQNEIFSSRFFKLNFFSIYMTIWGKILMIILFGCWLYLFDTQKVPEMRNIGLASIKAVWNQLEQKSIVMCKSLLHAKFQSISSIGGCFTAPSVWTSAWHLEVLKQKSLYQKLNYFL